jgi:MFS family permease
MKSLLGVVKKNSQAVPRPLLVISSTVALSLLGDQMLYAVLPAVYDTVGVPVTAVGLLLSANRLIRLLTNSLAGYVIERYGRHWPFVLALLLGGATTIAYGVVYGVWAFLVARLLWGTAWSFIRIEGMSTTLDVASAETRGRYMGLFQAISRLGSAVAMLCGGVLADTIGFHITFIVFGAFTCGAALLAHVEMRRYRPGRTPPTLSQAVPSTPSVTPSPVTTPGSLDRSTRWRMGVASFGTLSAFLVSSLVASTLGYMLRTRFGATPVLGAVPIGIASLTGVLLSTRGFLDLSFAPVAGYVADRRGRHRLIASVMPVTVLMVATLAVPASLWLVIGILLAVSITGVTLNVAFNAVAGDIVPPGKRSMFLSLFVTCQDLGAATGPLLGYWIGPAFGLDWLYLSGAGILLLASLMYVVTFISVNPRHRSGRG